MRLSSNMVDDDEINFPNKLLLTNRQVETLCKAFANKSLNEIKLSKIQLSKMIQLEGFLGRLLGPLVKTGLLLIKNVIKPLANSVLISLGLIAEFLMSPHPLTNFEIQKHYQNQTRFNDVYSRDNLSKIKDGVYVINLDEHSDIGTH